MLQFVVLLRQTPIFHLRGLHVTALMPCYLDLVCSNKTGFSPTPCISNRSPDNEYSNDRASLWALVRDVQDYSHGLEDRVAEKAPAH